jgi:hypothetical protein
MPILKISRAIFTSLPRQSISQVRRYRNMPSLLMCYASFSSTHTCKGILNVALTVILAYSCMQGALWVRQPRCDENRIRTMSDIDSNSSFY